MATYSQKLHFLFLLFLSLATLNARADICTNLPSGADKATCQRFAENRDWLTSVEVIPKKDSVIENLLVEPGRLYILETAGKYESKGFMMPANSALVGNGGKDSPAIVQLVFDGSDENYGSIALPYHGHNLIADIEINSPQLSGHEDVYSTYYMIGGQSQFELQGASLRLDSALFSSFTVIQALGLGVNSAGGEMSVSSVQDSTFYVPLAKTTDPKFSFGVALNVGEGSSSSFRFANNRVVTEGTNYVIGKPLSNALNILGSVQLESGSVCNCVVDSSGHDLLGRYHDNLLVGLNVNSVKDGAIGFTNNHAWGIRDTNQIEYASWKQWEKWGVDASCRKEGTCKLAASHKNNLGIKVGVPVAVIGLAGIIITGVAIIVYRYIVLRHRNKVEAALLPLPEND